MNNMPNNTRPDLFIFAGEASADLLGAELLIALKDNGSALKMCGVGGPKMRAEGFSCIAKMEDFRVMGFVDVFLALPKLVRQFFAIRKAILKMNPKMVLFIDYPGFNLRMAKSLRKKGFQGKLCHFVCPSVWAWGKGRIPIMEKTLDLLLTTFPFEERYFERTKLKVKYVGHPLAERIKKLPEMEELSFGSKQLIAIFPGSRKKEIVRNFPLYLRVAKRLLANDSNFIFGISLSHPSFLPLLQEITKQEGLIWDKEVTLIPPEQTYALMRSSLAAIAKSGTVTLELALHAVPTVVTYAISPLDLFIVKWLLRIRLPFYCIANIVYHTRSETWNLDRAKVPGFDDRKSPHIPDIGRLTIVEPRELSRGSKSKFMAECGIKEEEVFPELIGPVFTEESLYSHINHLLMSSDARKSCQDKCRSISTLLGEKDALKEAAKLIQNTIQ